MAKLFLCAGIISLLAACSDMSLTSNTSVMGASGYTATNVPAGGPLGASGGGP